MAKIPAAATQRPPVGLVLLGAVPAALVILPIAITVADAVTAGMAGMLVLVWRPLVGDLLINTLTLTLAACRS